MKDTETNVASMYIACASYSRHAPKSISEAAELMQLRNVNPATEEATVAAAAAAAADEHESDTDSCDEDTDRVDNAGEYLGCKVL